MARLISGDMRLVTDFISELAGPMRLWLGVA